MKEVIEGGGTRKHLSEFCTRLKGSNSSYHWTLPSVCDRIIVSLPTRLKQYFHIPGRAIPTKMLSLPSGSKTVEVQIIDTTTHMKSLPTSHFFQPDIQGWQTFSGGCYSFLITHTDHTGATRRLAFDLDVRKDWKNLTPGVVKMIENWADESGFTIKVDRDVSEILSGNGVDLRGVEAVIWRFIRCSDCCVPGNNDDCNG